MPGVILNAPGEGTAAIVGDTAKTIVGLRPVFSAQVRSDLSGPVCEVTLLGAGQSIAFEQRTDGLHLTLPSAAPAGLADNCLRIRDGQGLPGCDIGPDETTFRLWAHLLQCTSHHTRKAS